jgi:uncharacterized RDD family membrane protein YckC
LDEERFLDSDEAYAEWYAWAKREISPDPAVCVGAAQAALDARVDGADRLTAETTARKSPAGRGVLLAQRVSDRRRAYAEWYDWARREIGGDAERLHAAAKAALHRLETGGDSVEAARDARHAVGEPDPVPGKAKGMAGLERALAMTAAGAQAPMPDPPAKPSLMYGGFWRRVFALLIDGLILLTLVFISSIFLDSTPGIIDNNVAVLVWYVFWAIMFWGYFAGLESSSLQATLGKAALGLVVTDNRGGRANFGRTTGRHFGKWLSTLIIGIGYLLAAFTPQKQALHDMMSGSLVVKRDYVPLIASLADRGFTPPPPPPPPAPPTPTYSGVYGANP